MQITTTITVIPWRFSLKWVIKKNYFWRPIYSYSSIFENNKKPYLLNEIIQFLWCVFLPILSPTTIIPWRFFLNALYHIVYFIKVNKCCLIKWSCNFLQVISWRPPSSCPLLPMGVTLLRVPYHPMVHHPWEVTTYSSKTNLIYLHIP